VTAVTTPGPTLAGARRRVFSRTGDPNPLTHVDWFLVAIVLAISCLGIAMVYSTTNSITQVNELARLHFVWRQSLALGIGVVAMIVTAAFDYRRWRDLWPLVYGIVIPLLVIVRFIGTGQGGTTAWFDVGPLQFQPSEVAKLAIVIAVGGYCHAHRGRLDAWRLAVAVSIAAIAMGLTMLQNDLGTMLVMGGCTVALLYVAGLRLVHMLVLAALAATVLFALIATDTFDEYRLERLYSFVNQEPVDSATEANNTEYNLQQSKDAIAHGGLLGQGFGEGELTQNGFVPEQHTDFIFTAVGEELGFVGATSLLLMFALLAWRIWRAAMTAQDFQGTLLCIGVLAIFVFQIFENAGMTMGIMPITGIPLPFVSYGGSALIAYFAAIGIVINVHMRRFS
jgi:rod shape determining protein RodA